MKPLRKDEARGKEWGTMKLNGKALGLSLGLLWGGTVFLATIILLVKAHFGLHHESGAPIGPTLIKLGQFYIGYSMTWYGAIRGFIYGFINGYIGGVILAWVYNRFADG